MDGGNFVESISGWETGSEEACRMGKARINKGEERETEMEKTRGKYTHPLIQIDRKTEKIIRALENRQGR